MCPVGETRKTLDSTEMASRLNAQTAKKRTRILIIDDHPVIRKGIAALFDQEPDLEICGEADDEKSAKKAISRSRPDLALLDLSLKGSGDLSLLKDLHIQHPQLPIIVLSMHDETLYAERAIRAGARAYIMKSDASENILQAIRKVLGGEIYLSQRMASLFLEKMAGTGNSFKTSAPGSALSVLSDRELEVFRLFGEGLSTRKTAEQLHLSVKTVETHRSHIKTKLGIETATELARKAVLWANDEGLR